MNWLIAMEYLLTKWPRICISCRKLLSVLCQFVTYHQDCNHINTNGAGTATLPGHLSLPPIFIGVWNTRSLVLCVYLVDHCLSLWPFSFVNIIFHFLTRFMASDYPFGILRFSKLCHKPWSAFERLNTDDIEDHSAEKSKLHRGFYRLSWLRNFLYIRVDCKGMLVTHYNSI